MRLSISLPLFSGYLTFKYRDFRGNCRSLEMALFDRSHTSPIFIFHCNYDRISYRFRNREILVEKRQFSYALVFNLHGP